MMAKKSEDKNCLELADKKLKLDKREETKR